MGFRRIEQFRQKRLAGGNPDTCGMPGITRKTGIIAPYAVVRHPEQYERSLFGLHNTRSVGLGDIFRRHNLFMRYDDKTVLGNQQVQLQHIHAQVDHLKTCGLQHHSHQIFADIMKMSSIF